MFSRKFTRNTWLCVMLGASLSAHAQSPAQGPTQGGGTAEPAPAVLARKPSREAAEIAVINERIAVMAAQLAELEMLAKIAAKQSEIKAAKSVGKERSFALDDSFIPSVSEISGVDGRIWAVLNVRGGNTQTVRVGDRVGGWRVIEILADSVTVQKGSEKTRLAFGPGAPQPQPSGSIPGPVGASPVMPPFPTN